MGLDVTATHVIWAITLIGASVLAVGTVHTVQDDLDDSLRDRRDVHRDHLLTTLGPARPAYDVATQTLTISVRNDGKVPLDASGVTLILDGIVEAGSFTYEPTGASGSDVWLPGEDLVFTLPDRIGAPERIRVLTSTGVGVSATIPAGPLANVVVLPDPQDVAAGDEQVFEAYAFDANWHRVTGVTFTWSTNAGSIVSVDAETGRLTAQTTAESGLSVTATEDDSGVDGSATVNVVAGPVESLTVSPSSTTMAPSTSKPFTATGEDAYGNPVPMDGATWSTTVGTITAEGVLTAPATSATGTVTASKDGMDGTADVIVRRYSYAAESFTDVAGGTVTNAVAWTQATGDVATLTETAPTVTVTRPEAQNDRDFEAAPVNGWSLTAASGSGTLAQTGTDGTPTATGALEASGTSGGQPLLHVEHAWTQTAQIDPSDATFNLDYRFMSGSHPNRDLEAWLVKPDGSSVQIGTTQSPSGTGWTAFGSTTVAGSDLTAAGTYTLRIVISLQGNGDTVRLDNVELSWTATDDYRFGKALTVPDVPGGTGAVHALEVRYRVSAGTEPLQLWVEGPPGSWTQRGTLASTTLTTASVTLTADDVNASTLNLRLIDDARGGDVTENAWEVDYVRVSSSG